MPESPPPLTGPFLPCSEFSPPLPADDTPGGDDDGVTNPPTNPPTPPGPGAGPPPPDDGDGTPWPGGPTKPTVSGIQCCVDPFTGECYSIENPGAEEICVDGFEGTVLTGAKTCEKDCSLPGVCCGCKITKGHVPPQMSEGVFTRGWWWTHVEKTCEIMDREDAEDMCVGNDPEVPSVFSPYPGNGCPDACQEHECPEEIDGPPSPNEPGPPVGPGGGGGGGGSNPLTAPSYCSPSKLQVLQQEDNLIQSTLYDCIPLNEGFNSNIHDLCNSKGSCSHTTLESKASYITYPSFGKKTMSTQVDVVGFERLFPSSTDTQEGLPLQWDTILDDDISTVIGVPYFLPQYTVPIYGKETVAFRGGYALPLVDSDPELFVKVPYSTTLTSRAYTAHLTEGGINIVTPYRANQGGSVFIVEQFEGALDATVVLGAGHAIYLAEGDSFAPTNAHPKGKVLYGNGTILFTSRGGINLAKFDGAIKTAKGKVIFSKPTYRYPKQGKQTINIRSSEHLQSLRLYDPLFLRPSISTLNNKNMVIDRQPFFQNKGYQFTSWENPGDAIQKRYYEFGSVPYISNSREILDSRFTFPNPTAEMLREINQDYIEYRNLDRDSLKVFSTNVHRGLGAVLDIIKNNRRDYRPEYFYDINLDKIRKSLRGGVAAILRDIPDSFGDLLNEEPILQGIYNLTINGEIDRFDIGYFIEYIQRTAKFPYYWQKEGYTQQRSLTTIPTTSSKFGQGMEEIRQSLEGEATPAVEDDDLPPPGEEDAVAYAITNRKSLDFRDYGVTGDAMISEENVDKMKRWWILPQDMNLRVPITFPSGKEGFLFVRNDKSLQFISPEDRVIRAKIDREYQTIFYTPEGAKAFTLESNYNDIHFCYTLERAQEAKMLTNMGVDNLITMRAETSDSLIEFDYDLSAPLKTVYYLKMDPDTLVDKPALGEGEDFIKNTQVTYDVCSYEDVRSFAEEYPWPALKLYVYVQDPILNIITQENKVMLDYTNFSLDFMGLPNLRFPRRISPLIYLIPTDKTENCPYYGESTLDNLSTGEDKLRRSLGFTSHFDTSRTAATLKTLPMFTKIYPRRQPAEAEASGLTPADYGFNAFEYVLNPAYFKEENYYKDRVQPTVRRKSAIRQARDVIMTLKDYFVLDQGLTEYDVWSRIEAQPFYAIRNSSLFNFTTIKQLFLGSRDSMGSAYTNVRIYKNAAATNLTPSKGIEYFSRSRIIETKADPVLPTVDMEKYLREVYINPSDGTGVSTGVGTDTPQAPANSKPGRDTWR